MKAKKIMVSHGMVTHNYGDKCDFCDELKREAETVIELLKIVIEKQRKEIKRDLLKLADKYESEDTRIVIEDYFRK